MDIDREMTFGTSIRLSNDAEEDYYISRQLNLVLVQEIINKHFLNANKVFFTF